MTLRQRAVFVFLVWVAVYPGVLGFNALFDVFGIDLAVWLRILISTALTVPLISLLVIPYVNKATAAAEGQTVAELKRAQADAADK